MIKPWHRIAKIILSVWITAVLLAGFLLSAATGLPILEQTARNLYFHVPMWFTMMAVFFTSAYYSVQVLRTGNLEYDVRAREMARVGILFGLVGLVTGMVWARFTWYVGTGKWWNFDPKQTLAAVQILICFAYFVLRSGLDEPRKRARIAAVYNLFATVSIIFTLYVLPRQMDSLHPGADGNPAFDQITDPVMRWVFYPAIIGFIGLAFWLAQQRVRAALIEQRLTEDWT